MNKGSDSKDFADQEGKQTEEKFYQQYQLQFKDEPSAMIISKPLDGNNYNAWSRAMSIVLGAHEKLDFINGQLRHQLIRAQKSINSGKRLIT